MNAVGQLNDLNAVVRSSPTVVVVEKLRRRTAACRDRVVATITKSIGQSVGYPVRCRPTGVP